MRKAKLVNFTGEYKFLFVSKNGFTEKALSRIKEIHGIGLDLKDINGMFEEI